MALVKCKECGKEISTKADKCPHCGAPIKKSANIGCLGSAIAIIFILMIIVQVSECSEERSKQNAILEKAKITEQRAREEKQQPEEKCQKELKTFEANIDKHYSEIVKFIEKQQFDKAQSTFSLFQKFEKTDYKDVKKYYKTIKTQTIAKKVKKLPASDIEGNLRGYRNLLTLNPENQTFKDKVHHYQKKWDQYIKEKQQREYRASCQLEIVSSNWSKGYGYATYEGQVKNISSLKLNNVQAVVTWYDKNGNMITSSSALIEYNPILPGQSSPFKVMKTYNPAMEKAGVEFSHLRGGTIRTYRKK